MLVVFRVDASRDIGSGHVMRCLTLADELTGRDIECHFVIRQQAGDLTEFVERQGYRVHRLGGQTGPQDIPPAQIANRPLYHSHWLLGGQEKDAHDTAEVLRELRPDWLVVDHYGIDKLWEASLSQHYRHLMVIDDLADREHLCQMLLDQNLGRRAESYSGLVPNSCKVLAGPTYALLRSEFRKQREKTNRQAQKLQHLLINLGGVDKDNVTGSLLNALRASDLPKDMRISVVMGGQAPWIESVKAEAASLPWRTEVLVGVSNMAEIMADADLALGAAGGTAWERCCLGLPSILVVLAENQRAGASALAKAGAAIDGGTGEQVVANLDRLLLEARTRWLDLTAASSALCDGTGAIRTADTMIEISR